MSEYDTSFTRPLSSRSGHEIAFSASGNESSTLNIAREIVFRNVLRGVQTCVIAIVRRIAARARPREAEAAGANIASFRVLNQSAIIFISILRMRCPPAFCCSHDLQPTWHIVAGPLAAPLSTFMLSKFQQESPRSSRATARSKASCASYTDRLP